MTGYIDFEFDLPGALLQRLINVLDALGTAPLSPEGLVAIPEEQGVYQLLLDNKLVYIGKTDAEAGLRKRLTRHSKKILYRNGLAPDRVTFKCVRIYVFTAVDLEADLIRHYGGVKAIPWNGSGFGSNDPGRERDTTKVDSANFDARYPIDIDRSLAFAVESNERSSSALARLKEALPFNLRYQGVGGRSRKAHPELESAILPAAAGPMSSRDAIQHIVTHLPPGWQATALPGYIILYKEQRIYESGKIIVRS
jgi:hypothetical protein